LKTLEEASLDKFREINTKFSGEITGPHITFKPRGYDSQRNTVLYIGKALGAQDAQPGNPSVEDRRDAASDFLDKVVGCRKFRKYPFWNFALQLAKRIAGSDYDEDRPLQNLIWSNICKIGECKGNPKGEVFAEQNCLAVETLRAEIEYYKPRLVMWVSGIYGHDVVWKVTNDPHEEHWEKSPEDDAVYFRRRMHSLPAMLWTYHPQGPYRNPDLWIREACKLLNLKG
jgi:hypothetical protein